MNLYFLQGTLCHLPLIKAVLGAAPAWQDGVLRGVALFDDSGWSGGGMAPDPDGMVPGKTAELSAEQAERFGFFAAVTGAFLARLTLADGRSTTAMLRQPPAGAASGWILQDWVARWGAIATCAAQDIMAHFGTRAPDTVAQALPQILVRAASRARAQDEATPVQLRHGFDAGDLRVSATRQPYLKYFGLVEQDISFRRFDGTASEVVERAAFVSGDAVTVLPYDPVRDRVLVIEQFRFGPFVRGDRSPWSLEPIAGRIDPGETPATAARRESTEEAGLTPGRLEPIGNYYPSPGALSEYLFSYLGLCDLPDNAAGLGGLQSEQEDIRGVLLSFDQLMALLATGEAQNGPLILSALWLSANRDRLRRNA